MGIKLLKSGIVAVIMLVLLKISTQIVFADVVVGPPERKDEFYEKHSSECNKEYKAYITDGMKGYVTVWLSPKKHVKVTTIYNKSRIYVYYTYRDKNNELWGYIKDSHGWVKMDEITRNQDGSAFNEEYHEQFRKYNGEFDNHIPTYSIILWSYPGSGVIVEVLENDLDTKNLTYTYEDKNHRLWCYYDKAGDYGGGLGVDRIVGWVCITEPDQTDLPVIDYGRPTIIPPAKQVSSDLVMGAPPSIIFIGISLLLLIITTAILIHYFWKKEKKNESQEKL